MSLEPAPVRNVALLRRLASTIREDPARYSPGTFGLRTDCGTVACFAGWTMILVHGEDACFPRGGTTLWAPVLEGDTGSSVVNQATEALGLTVEEQGVLFNYHWRPAHGLTPADAIDALADGASVASITDWALFDEDNITLGRNLRTQWQRTIADAQPPPAGE